VSFKDPSVIARSYPNIPPFRVSPFNRSFTSGGTNCAAITNGKMKGRLRIAIIAGISPEGKVVEIGYCTME